MFDTVRGIRIAALLLVLVLVGVLGSVQPARAAPRSGGVEARVLGVEPAKNGGDVGPQTGSHLLAQSWHATTMPTIARHTAHPAPRYRV